MFQCGLDFPSVVECMKRRLQKNLGKHARGKSLQAVHKYFLGIIKEVTDICEYECRGYFAQVYWEIARFITDFWSFVQ